MSQVLRGSFHRVTGVVRVGSVENRLIRNPLNFNRMALKLSGTLAAIMLLVLVLTVHATAQTSVLPSWNDGLAKQAIVSFVKEVTDTSSNKYVEPQDRIATFDQDGALWVGHPLY